MSFVQTAPGADPIIVECHFPVPPARVYRAWTDPETVKQWFGSEPGALDDAAIDLRPGGRWRFAERTDDDSAAGFEGEYVEAVQDQLLVFTWSKFTRHANGETDTTPISRVEIRFTAAGLGTEMQITHSSLDRQSRIEFGVGWARGTANLAALLTGSAGRAR